MDIIINGTSVKGLGVTPFGLTGVGTPLELKEPGSYDNPSEHGKRYDLTAPRFAERPVTLRLALTGEGAFHDLLTLRGLLTGSTPARVVIVGREDRWDMDMVLLRSEISRPVPGAPVAEMVLEMSEPAPVKRVYKVTGDTASFTTAHKDGLTQPKLTFSWGDGTFDEGRAGTHEHTYHDGQTEHYVIVSGVVEDCEITTTANLEYSVLW